ncbi:MAG: flagellar hook capping protein [Myxococcales bacterium]|nr:flagellar hook capping protein [Myxococcales bacterium]
MYVGSASTAAAANRAGSADNSEMGKEDFLQLLTTQLANQDPLNPMDNTQFASQLAEFSGLEQLINIGQGMEQLALAQAVNNGTDMVGFIGKEVVFQGNGFTYDGDGGEDLTVDLADPASKVTVSVYDDEGTLVSTFESGPMEGGVGDVHWDGTDLNGQPVPAGDYTFEVSAEDVEGNRVEASTRRSGVVSGVTYESGYPELMVGGQKIAVGDIVEVVTGDDDDNDNSSNTPRATEPEASDDSSS